MGQCGRYCSRLGAVSSAFILGRMIDVDVHFSKGSLGVSTIVPQWRLGSQAALRYVKTQAGEVSLSPCHTLCWPLGLNFAMCPSHVLEKDNKKAEHAAVGRSAPRAVVFKIMMILNRQVIRSVKRLIGIEVRPRHNRKLRSAAAFI